MRLCVSILLGYSVLIAQEITGTLTGIVADSTGAAIAGAEIVATHTETGAVRRTKSGADGEYTITSLPIGAWNLRSTHTGFQTAEEKGITLHIGDRIRADFKLQPGNVSESVTVEASAVAISTESSEQGGVISGEQVRELQLNGRSFMTLIELLPGVSSDLPDRVDPNTPPSLSINGNRSSNSSFTIDGGTNSDVIVGSGSLNTFTSVDTIAEFRVVTSTFAAEYGRGGTSQVNVVTRGGTRRFRGSVYEFFRNDALDAKDYLTHQVLPLKLNNFGYNIHGPVVLPGYNKSRRKTFFFWTQEWNLTTTRGAAVNTTVPDPAFRTGDFSSLGSGRDGQFGTTDDPIVDPLNNNLGFPEGKIPQSRIIPEAKKLLDLYPLPNFRGPGTINYTSAAASTQKWREFMGRIDHNFTDNWKLYGRFTQDLADVDNPYGGWQTTQVGTNFPGLNRTFATVNGRNVNLSTTRVFSRNLLSETVFTWSERRIQMDPANPDVDRKALGVDLPKLFPENGVNTIPNIALTSMATLNVTRPWLKKLFNADLSSNLTKIAGRHALKAGIVYAYGGNRENPTGPTVNGSYSFTTNFSKNAVANMLLGLPNSYTEAERLVVSHSRFSLFEAFAQDDYRVHPRFTLNYGVRWTNYYNPWDTDNVLTNFIPSMWDGSKAPQINRTNGQRIPGTGDPLNGVVIAGQNSPYGRKIAPDQKNLFGPRLGFAWDPTGKQKTAIRAGYGMYYTRILIGTFINSAFDNAPFNRSVTILTPDFLDPRGGSVNPEPAPTLTAMSTDLKPAQTHQWSFGIDQQIGKGGVLRVSYVGSKGTHLLRPTALNNPLPGSIPSGANVNFVRPYQGWGAITIRESTANSNYNSLQVSANRRMSKHVTLTASYTWSKSIDNASTERGGSDIPPNPLNARAERALSDFDRPHIFTGSYIWYLPRFTTNRIAGFMVNGWQVSGISRLHAGRPFDVVMSTDVAGIGTTQNQRPNIVAPMEGPKTVEEWFNRRAFARPATGTFGNMGRNVIRGPGINRHDVSLMKNFYMTERRYQTQFRAEFFNAPNHVSFSTVGNSLTTTTTGVNPDANNFGVVTGTRDARVLQFALKVSF